MLPLKGVKVVDFTRLLPGPLATYWLSGLGAEIHKIEDKKLGDYSKYMGVIRNKVSLPYAILNANKKNYFLDVEQKSDREKILELIKDCDVLIESFRPETMKKWGLDFESVKKINPKIVYCSLTGFGQTGPLKDKAGHDINYLALSGVLDQVGHHQPELSNFQVADIASGSLSAVTGIVSGLYFASRNQKGLYIDCSMLDNTFCLNPLLLSHLNNNKIPLRGVDLLTGAHPGYAVYEIKNNRFVALGALEKKFWKAFCEYFNRPDWIDQIDSLAKWPELKIAVAALLKSLTLSDVEKISQDTDFCLTPVYEFQEAANSDWVKEKSLLVEQNHPTEGRIKLFEMPIKFSQ